MVRWVGAALEGLRSLSQPASLFGAVHHHCRYSAAGNANVQVVCAYGVCLHLLGHGVYQPPSRLRDLSSRALLAVFVRRMRVEFLLRPLRRRRLLRPTYHCVKAEYNRSGKRRQTSRGGGLPVALLTNESSSRETKLKTLDNMLVEFSCVTARVGCRGMVEDRTAGSSNFVANKQLGYFTKLLRVFRQENQ